MTLARVDALIEIARICLRDDGADWAGGYRQKRYHDTLNDLDPLAKNQLLWVAMSFVDTWLIDLSTVELVWMRTMSLNTFL